jgi:hypothetical protein
VDKWKGKSTLWSLLGLGLRVDATLDGEPLQHLTFLLAHETRLEDLG